VTYMINGIGTRICGSRDLTKSEYIQHIDRMEYEYGEVRHKIGTVAFCVLFIPIIPIETIIYTDVSSNKYISFCTYGVNWQLVKTSMAFYIFPLLLIAWILGIL
jgi:hypothetical protein